MSLSKRIIANEELKSEVAKRILLESKVFKECPYHEGTFFQTGESVLEAYKVGNHQYSQDSSHGELFGSRMEMTDAIKEVFEDHPMENCPHCERVGI